MVMAFMKACLTQLFESGGIDAYLKFLPASSVVELVLLSLAAVDSLLGLSVFIVPLREGVLVHGLHEQLDRLGRCR